MGLSTAARAY
jgi:hypothetical protein